MRKKSKALAVAMCALVLALGVNATYAYLTDKTEAVVNTFTVGNIDITLEETTTEYKMVPGQDIGKDPKVTVEADSEKCWLFVEVAKSTDKPFDDYMTFAIAEGWTELKSGIYYREVGANDEDQAYSVLKEDKVTVLTSVTKGMMDDIDGVVDGIKDDGTQKTEAEIQTEQNAEIAKRPTLTFTAYAVQMDGFKTAADAWIATFGAPAQS